MFNVARHQLTGFFVTVIEEFKAINLGLENLDIDLRNRGRAGRGCRFEYLQHRDCARAAGIVLAWRI
jgi:hypothetical protein